MNTSACRSFLALTLALAGCAAQAADAPAPTPPDDEVWLTPQQRAHVKLGMVAPRPIDDTLRLGGRIAFDDLRVSHVFSPVNGRVTQVLAGLGQRVKKGTPLAEIVSPEVGSAFSDLLKAQSELTAADHELRRQKELYEAHAGPQRDYEVAQDNYAKAKAECERARQQTRMFAKTSGSAVSHDFILRAPIDGEVVSRSVNPGMEVQGQYSGGSAELFTIGEIDVVDVYAELHEQNVGKVAVGQKVALSVVAYPGRSFEGTVDFVAPALDPSTRTAKLRCRVENPERLLKPEMFATVAVPHAGPPQLAVPRSAVVQLGGKTMVFVDKGAAGDGRARFERRPVTLDDEVSGDFFPVLGGVAAGEHVVVDGALLLSQVS